MKRSDKQLFLKSILRAFVYVKYQFYISMIVFVDLNL